MISSCVVTVIRFWVIILFLHGFLPRVLKGGQEAMRRPAVFPSPAYSLQV